MNLNHLKQCLFCWQCCSKIIPKKSEANNLKWENLAEISFLEEVKLFAQPNLSPYTKEITIVYKILIL